jgi:chemosensory pili system protein ChpA (sensor histidine kinase/response regulator)
MENLLEQLPALPARERWRKVEVLGDVVVAVKRILEMIGDDGREDVNTVAGLRARYPELFPAPTAPEPPLDPVRLLERRPAAPTANAATVPSPTDEPVVAVEAKPKPTTAPLSAPPPSAPPSATRPVPEAPTAPIDEIVAGRLLRELERFFAEHAESVPYFAPEAAEHLDVMSRSLLALEQSTGAEREEEVATLFRAVHTLKGAAYTVGCAPVGDVAHRIEDILDGVRDRRLELRPAVIEAIFGGLDTLRLLLDRTVGASSDARAAVQRTLDVLDGLRPAPVPLELAVP